MSANDVDELIPILVYADLQAAHDFLVEVFGFRPGGVTADAGGRVVHAEVYVGNRAIWLHRAAPEHGLAPPSSAELLPCAAAVVVDDVDAHWARVSAAGARVTGSPVDQGYGYREYGAIDLEGGRWYFLSPIPR